MDLLKDLKDFHEKVKNSSKEVYERYKYYVDSLLECILIFIISNIPFAVLVISSIADNKNYSFCWDSIRKIIGQNIAIGEVLVYISALIAPVMAVMIKYHRARRHFPMFTMLFFVQTLVVVVAVIFFMKYKSGPIVNLEFVSSGSFFLYIISLIMWYISIVYEKKLVDNPYKNEKSGAESILEKL